MAIVNITRIQHRRGDHADLPTPLASGELGWAIDSQQLYIGNGSLAEGAPYVGNTEILTEHSDLASLLGFLGSTANSFTFTSNSVAAPVASGVERTIASKLNDTVSVRDFGADGDGNECSGAINQALSELFRTGDQQTRMTLYFPAGTYLIGSALELPPNTIIVGDGMGNTIIKTDNATPLIRTVDANGDSGGSMGLVSTQLPDNILIRDVTFWTTTDTDMTELQSTTNLVLDRVEFLGVYSDISDDVTNSGQIGLGFVSPGSPSASGKITVTGSRFRQLGRAFQQTELLYDISFERCLFDTCWIGINLDITNPDILDPVTVQNCYFHDISREAIYAGNTTKFTSISNRFVNVGNQGTGSPLYSVLTSEGEGSVSWMDRFDRLATALTPGNLLRINFTSSGAAQTIAYADSEDRFRWGLKETLRTYSYIVSDGTTENLYEIRVKPGVGYNGNTYHQEIRYVLKVGTSYTRTGTLRLAVHSTSFDLTEEYNYVGSSTVDDDISFSASRDGATGEVSIDCDNAGLTDATLVVSATNLLIE